jgi:hypothetical protein
MKPRMEYRGVQIETLQDAERYTQAQLERAWAVATLLKRGKLILIEEPEG